MLYRLENKDGRPDRLEPLAFKDFGSLGHLEKDLEDLIARHLLDVLFEEAGLMPVFQERSWQPEADLYALDAQGDLTIFELKRSSAGADAVQQALRYAQEAGQWSFAQLEERYRQYTQPAPRDMLAAHQEAFQLEHPLEARECNRRQRLVIIGSAADIPLMQSVDYWKRQGIRIDFLPYRLYEIAGARYFEFFAPPYDQHSNPDSLKGVLFDTNRSWDEDSLWYMMENARVAAFGEAKRFVEYVSPGDVVFFSHRYLGLVAAARVRKGPVRAVGDNELYRDVDFLTPVPVRGQPIPFMPFARVVEFTGKNFFWARTIKVPYLGKDEADALLGELARWLSAGSPPPATP